GLHLAPVAAIDVRRKNHQPLAAARGRRLGLGDGLGGGERRDRAYYGDALADRFDNRRPEARALLEAQRIALAERAGRDDTGASVIDKPARVARDKLVINAQILLEAGGHCRHDAAP